MTIMTENFEATDAAMDGGYDYTDRYGNKMKSLEGMARWQPSNGFRKGGAGTYHMELHQNIKIYAVLFKL